MLSGCPRRLRVRSCSSLEASRGRNRDRDIESWWENPHEYIPKSGRAYGLFQRISWAHQTQCPRNSSVSGVVFKIIRSTELFRIERPRGTSFGDPDNYQHKTLVRDQPLSSSIKHDKAQAQVWWWHLPLALCLQTNEIMDQPATMAKHLAHWVNTGKGNWEPQGVHLLYCVADNSRNWRSQKLPWVLCTLQT